MVSPGILKISKLFENSEPEKVGEKSEKPLNEVMRKINTFEEMMCGSKSKILSLEKQKMKPKKKLKQSDKKVFKNIKNISEIEKWVKSAKSEKSNFEKGERESDIEIRNTDGYGSQIVSCQKKLKIESDLQSLPESNTAVRDFSANNLKYQKKVILREKVKEWDKFFEAKRAVMKMVVGKNSDTEKFKGGPS